MVMYVLGVADIVTWTTTFSSTMSGPRFVTTTVPVTVSPTRTVGLGEIVTSAW
jgi:hypothetical protein